MNTGQGGFIGVQWELTRCVFLHRYKGQSGQLYRMSTQNNIKLKPLRLREIGGCSAMSHKVRLR